MWIIKLGAGMQFQVCWVGSALEESLLDTLKYRRCWECPKIQSLVMLGDRGSNNENVCNHDIIFHILYALKDQNMFLNKRICFSFFFWTVAPQLLLLNFCGCGRDSAEKPGFIKSWILLRHPTHKPWTNNQYKLELFFSSDLSADTFGPLKPRSLRYFLQEIP